MNEKLPLLNFLFGLPPLPEDKGETLPPARDSCSPALTARTISGPTAEPTGTASVWSSNIAEPADRAPLPEANRVFATARGSKLLGEAVLRVVGELQNAPSLATLQLAIKANLMQQTATDAEFDAVSVAQAGGPAGGAMQAPRMLRCASRANGGGSVRQL